MKTSNLKYAALSWVSRLVMLMLLLMPFHAFLTVWASSILGHYTELRLWKESLLVLGAAGALFLVISDHKIRHHTLSRRLVWLIISYALVNVIWGVCALYRHSVNLEALGYGLVVNLRFLAFFLIAWAVSIRMSRLRINWQWLTLWPAAIVITFGLLQVFVLPHDFLAHFGYGPETIEPVETINSNSDYVRIFSSLRGPNPFGAYLIIPISVLAALLIKSRSNWRYWLMLISGGIVMLFSFSRSAWLGATLALGVVVIVGVTNRKTKRNLILTAWALALILTISVVSLRTNDHVENLVFHTQQESSIKSNSNDGHLSSVQDGLSDMASSPLGSGTGTAGPASVHNDHTARIAENYFIQIGQETGIIGLVLFIVINLGVGYLLWIRRADTLALGLLASLAGLSLVGLLGHVWTDDTVAYIWWGLAGIAMASPLVGYKESPHKTKKS